MFYSKSISTITYTYMDLELCTILATDLKYFFTVDTRLILKVVGAISICKSPGSDDRGPNTG